jgi:capsid portal protein
MFVWNSPGNPFGKYEIYKSSTPLLQCVNIYQNLIEGTGYAVLPVEKGASKRQAKALNDFFQKVNAAQSLTDLRKTLRLYLEVFGEAYLRIAVVPGTNIPQRLEAVDPRKIHATHFKPGLASIKSLVGPGIYPDTFRMYQLKTRENKIVWFKDANNVQDYSYISGEPVESGHAETCDSLIRLTIPMFDANIPQNRWISSINAVKGKKLAEETNLGSLDNTGLPPILLTVSGGVANPTNIEEIRQAFAGQFRPGVDKVLVLSAEGDMNNAAKDGATPSPQVKVEKLTKDTQDQQYTDYLVHSVREIRGCFRLPDILFGDVNATAFASIKAAIAVAEETVFKPERNIIDEIINNYVVTPYTKGKYIFSSKPSTILDKEVISSVLKNLDSIGAVTPNDSIDVINRIFDIDLKRIESIYGDMPSGFTRLLFSTRSKEDTPEKMVGIMNQFNETKPSEAKPNE